MANQEKINKVKAYSYYFPECNGNCREGWVLHHKDASWRFNDPERYKAWNIEDLIPMTVEEHAKLHHHGNQYSFGRDVSSETKKKISKALSGAGNGFYGTHLSDEHKLKISAANIGKCWWNNGEKNAYCFECPEGFVRGRLVK